MPLMCESGNQHVCCKPLAKQVVQAVSLNFKLLQGQGTPSAFLTNRGQVGSPSTLALPFTVMHYCDATHTTRTVLCGAVDSNGRLKFHALASCG